MNEEVRRVLMGAGWYPGRNIAAKVQLWADTLQREAGIEMFPAARRILIEFGDLNIFSRGPGLQGAKGSCMIDPSGAGTWGPFLEYFSDQLGCRLYPLGNVYDYDARLVVAESGRVSIVEDEVYWTVESMDKAFEVFILGTRPD